MNLLTSQSVRPGRRDGRSSPINIYLKACIMEMDGMDGVPSYTNHSIIQYYTFTYAFSCFQTVLQTEPSHTFDWFIYYDSRRREQIVWGWNLRKVISSPHKTCLCVFMSVLCVAMSVSRPERYECFWVFLCVSCEVSMSVSRRENLTNHFCTRLRVGKSSSLRYFRNVPTLAKGPNSSSNQIARSCHPGQCHFV